MFRIVGLYLHTTFILAHYTYRQGNVEAILFVTLLYSQEVPTTEQIVRIRSSLLTELLLTPTVMSVENIRRYGKAKIMFINMQEYGYNCARVVFHI